MRLGRYIDIIDKVMGDIIFTSTSKYTGHRAAENAVRYCHKHGYKIVEFDGKYDRYGYYHINTAYVIPAEYSTVEEYKQAIASRPRPVYDGTTRYKTVGGQLYAICNGKITRVTA